MKENRTIGILLVALSLIFGTAIIYYFWSVETLEACVNLPVYVVILSFCYVLAQILKRYFFNRKNWWDWLYYIGLLAIVLPSFLMTEKNASFFHLFTDFGTFFLIIPALLDGKLMLNNKS